MSLPRSVRRQAQAAADHFENPTPEDESLLGGAPEDDSQPPAEDDLVEDTAKKDEQPSDAKVKDEPQPDAEDRDASYWRHRHNVLQGKYNAEVPKLHTEIRELKRTIAEKDRELEQKPQAGSAQSDLTDEQLSQFKETFGEDVVDMVTRLIEQKSGSSAREPDHKVEDLDSRLERIEREKEEDREARFWSDLEHDVPKWREINADPKFLQWLGLINPNTRRTYQDDLVEAQQASDARGVGQVFKLFLKQSQTESKEPRKEVPEEDIEPKTSKSTQPPPSAGSKRTWTGKDIDQFYRRKMQGKYSKDEAQRLEADIFAAQKEGRVVS